MTLVNSGNKNSCYNIPFFGNPAEGETLYSVFCRFFQRSGLPYTHVLRKMTGQRNKTSIISSIPGYLKRIANTLPIENPGRDVKAIIIKNTIIPYFTYFDDKKESEAITNEFVTDFPLPLMLKIGMSTYTHSPIAIHPRYCPKCIYEQREEVGFPFFRREHQLPAVAVCWLHNEPLAQGCEICGPYPLKRRAFSIPGRCHCKDNATPLLAYSKLPNNREPFEWFAVQSAIIVRSKNNNHIHLKKILKQMLIDNGLSRGSIIQYCKIADAIEARFGKEFINWLKLDTHLNGRPSAWIRRFFRQSSNQFKRSPTIQYLLLIGTIFDSVQEFKKSIVNHSPLTTNATQLNTDSNIIKAPDFKNPTPPYSEWIGQLSEIAENSKVGLPGLAIHLNVNEYQIIKELKQQGIRFPLTNRFRRRLGNKSISAIKKKLRDGVPKNEIQRQFNCSEWSILLIELDQPGLNQAHLVASKNNRKKQHRENVLNYLKKNPKAVRLDIQQNIGGTYDYIIKNDKEWFQATVKRNSNPKRKKAPKWRKNWGEVDREKSEELLKFINKSMKYDEKPVLLTKTASLKHVKILQKYMGNPQRFPKIAKLINENVETYTNFEKRRIRWALKNMAKNGIEVSVNRLRREASLKAENVRKHKEYVIEQSKKLKVGIHDRSFFV